MSLRHLYIIELRFDLIQQIRKTNLMHRNRRIHISYIFFISFNPLRVFKNLTEYIISTCNIFNIIFNVCIIISDIYSQLWHLMILLLWFNWLEVNRHSTLFWASYFNWLNLAYLWCILHIFYMFGSLLILLILDEHMWIYEWPIIRSIKTVVAKSCGYHRRRQNVFDFLIGMLPVHVNYLVRISPILLALWQLGREHFLEVVVILWFIADAKEFGCFDGFLVDIS